MPKTKYSADTLNAAIEGFEHQKLRIDSQIAELRAMLSGINDASGSPNKLKTRKQLSAASRQRMREAQQLRWDTVRGKTEAQPVPGTKAKAKRKLSSAGRAAIVEALKKRWAAKKATEGKPPVKKTASKKSAAKAAKA